MSIDENIEMVDSLVERGYLTDSRVIDAFKKVDRANFIKIKFGVYDDCPQHIGLGQTISAPSMVAIMTQNLDVKTGQKVLEIGAGSGYQAAILAELAGKNGKVYTIERLEEIADFARGNLSKYENVEVIVGDGTLGYEEKTPYDRIMVTASTPQVPKPLVEQLKDDGVMGIPVGDRLHQQFILVKKVKGKVEQENICGCVFVPLIGKYGWKEDG